MIVYIYVKKNIKNNIILEKFEERAKFCLVLKKLGKNKLFLWRFFANVFLYKEVLE